MKSKYEIIYYTNDVISFTLEIVGWEWIDVPFLHENDNNSIILFKRSSN